MYRKYKDPITNQETGAVIRLSDNAYIPVEPTNYIYKEYLEWLDEGNTPEEAE